jgi:hypothetical protein
VNFDAESLVNGEEMSPSAKSINQDPLSTEVKKVTERGSLPAVGDTEKFGAHSAGFMAMVAIKPKRLTINANRLVHTCMIVILIDWNHTPNTYSDILEHYTARIEFECISAIVSFYLLPTESWLG